MRPQFTYTCEQCGEAFLRRKRPAGRNRYCSKRCAGVALRGRPLEERFWEKVDKNGPIPEHCPELGPCWVWTASCSHAGYGKFGVAQNNLQGAHRVAWEMAHGPIPEDQIVCHTCDNPPCVNAAHLFLGTHASNAADKVLKGRARYGPSPGERNGNAKLSADQVRQMRQDRANGASARALAAQYRVCREHVYNILSGRNWREL